MVVLVHYIFQAGGIDMIDQYTERGKFLFCVLGVLHNLAKRPLNKKVFNKCSVMPVLLPLIKVPVMTFAVEALLTLVYLVNDKNNDMLLADQGLLLRYYTVLGVHGLKVVVLLGLDVFSKWKV